MADAYQRYLSSPHWKAFRLEAIVAEQIIGRVLTKNDVVHHINGKRSDNRLDNLCVCTRSEHKGIHGDMSALIYQLLEKGVIVFTDNTYQLKED